MIRNLGIWIMFVLLLLRAWDARAGGAGMAVGPGYAHGPSRIWIVVVILVICAAIVLGVRAYRRRK